MKILIYIILFIQILTLSFCLKNNKEKKIEINKITQEINNELENNKNKLKESIIKKEELEKEEKDLLENKKDEIKEYEAWKNKNQELQNLMS